MTDGTLAIEQVEPPALDYAPPPPEPVLPSVTDDGTRLEINLGSAGRATFVTRIALTGSFLAVSAFLAIVLTGRMKYPWLAYSVFSAIGLVFAIRSRLVPDAIVADAQGIAAHGPTAGAVQVGRDHIVRFHARRDGCFWLWQLLVSLVPDGLSRGSEHVIALGRRVDVIRAVEQLNGWLSRSPVPATRGVPAAIRRQNYLILAVSLAVTIGLGFWLARAGIESDPGQTLVADLYFIAAVVVVAFPNLLLYGHLSCRGSTATTPPNG